MGIAFSFRPNSARVETKTTGYDRGAAQVVSSMLKRQLGSLVAFAMKATGFGCKHCWLRQVFVQGKGGVMEAKHLPQFQDVDKRWLAYHAASSEITDAVDAVHVSEDSDKKWYRWLWRKPTSQFRSGLPATMAAVQMNEA